MRGLRLGLRLGRGNGSIVEQIIQVAGAGVDPTNAEALFVGETANANITDNTTFLTNSNYESSAGSITSVVFQINESNAVGTAPFADGDSVSYLVTDSAANTRRFYVDTSVTHVAPSSAGGLVDQSFTKDTGVQTYDASGDFTGSALAYSVNTVTGVSINSSTGLVSFDTDAMSTQVGTSIVVTATNSGGSVNSGFSLAITLSPYVFTDNSDGTVTMTTKGSSPTPTFTDNNNGTVTRDT